MYAALIQAVVSTQSTWGICKTCRLIPKNVVRSRPYHTRLKIKIISMSRISIVYNALIKLECPSNNYDAFKGIECLRNYNTMKGRWDVIPQLKARSVEAALAGSVLLVWDEGSRILDTMMTPGVHFVYWREESELAALVKNVTENWQLWEPMVKRAQELVVSKYSLERFVGDYILPFTDPERQRA
eukprot:NODE_1311_length_1196_cov_69.058413_g1079_i0.p1 GENE.NODE_1311_length_1196_cov_69.058413_g1079_i0~~NODE_1311_length_1196_cov_69.058413_g1079_i0.p1  ORF type:complete len:185 (+),score=26.03 NODE_1311_length_1196_cov_69.058413_g1079_i0:576-1130(+)